MSSRRLRLVTPTETSIILNITKTECNNCFITHSTKKNMTWLPVTLSVLDRIIVQSAARWRHRRWFRKFTVRFRPIRKEILCSLYNKYDHCMNWWSIASYQMPFVIATPHLHIFFTSKLATSFPRVFSLGTRLLNWKTQENLYLKN